MTVGRVRQRGSRPAPTIPLGPACPASSAAPGRPASPGSGGLSSGSPEARRPSGVALSQRGSRNVVRTYRGSQQRGAPKGGQGSSIDRRRRAVRPALDGPVRARFRLRRRGADPPPVHGSGLSPKPQRRPPLGRAPAAGRPRRSGAANRPAATSWTVWPTVGGNRPQDGPCGPRAQVPDSTSAPRRFGPSWAVVGGHVGGYEIRITDVTQTLHYLIGSTFPPTNGTRAGYF